MRLCLLINFSGKNSLDKGQGKKYKKSNQKFSFGDSLREGVEGKRLERMAKDLLCCVVYKNKNKKKKIMK